MGKYFALLLSMVLGSAAGASDLVELGRHLYFDKRLSADDTISCNSCHNVLKHGSGTDNLPTSKGINGQFGGRNAPTVWNSKFWSVQFWDGRAKDLADQAKGPITNPIEMGMPSHDVTIKKVKKIKGYQAQFSKAFPKEKDPINIENLAKAIAVFEETLVTKKTPFEAFQAGEKKAISELAVRGHKTFQEVGCITCHSGPHFNGPSLPVGTGFYMKFPTFENEKLEKKYQFKADEGRFEVTKKEADKHMWRVPSLRNVALTAPYFHNGKVKELKEAIRVMAKLQLNRDLSAKQVNEIHAFLKSLTGDRPLVKEPVAYK